MIAGCLKAVNFRNLQEISFTPCPGVNVLFGDNAQGKTNLIEALWLFTGARSFRGSKDAEFIGFGQKFSRLSLDFSARGIDNVASIVFSDSKQSELNGVKLDSVSSLAGHFCAVVFSPDHLDLVKEGPSERRKFIDCAITEILPRHAAAVAEYRELLRQRNALLKDIPAHSELFDTLPVWDEKLSQSGAHIVFTRLRYLNRLSSHAAEVYCGIASKSEQSEKKEFLDLEYEAAGSLAYPADVSKAKEAVSQIREQLFSQINLQRKGDIECGYTRSGPHRDDLKISIGGLDARLYGSQGQQRSAVLALKLAEAAVLKETIGEPPVLLLDDVMSELDRYRQDYILNNIGGCQVFITCCDPAGLECLEGGGIFKIDHGEITRQSFKITN
jgi:DNA replication and repair protein RecF